VPFRVLTVTALVLALMTTAHAGARGPKGKAPRVASQAVVVLDVSSGAELLAKHADDPRPIASMTKIFVAMVLRRHGLDTRAYSTITEDDVATSVGGSKTRLAEGKTFRNLDLLHAMLMVSDNRAPTALARSVGLSRDDLLAEMNALAEELGLTHTRFEDVTGILGNTSTAREIAIALRETLKDPLLAKIMRTRKVRIFSKDKKTKIEYRSTVEPLHDQNYLINGGKTGHTDGAGFCMMIEAAIGGREYVMAFLGGANKKTRFLDFGNVAIWLDGGRRPPPPKPD
jgi:serine-type D-Ala-D-Ala endopeptidase (penicillin-binding protein 7)